MITKSIIVFVLVCIISCNNGIEPSKEEITTGFSGTITFEGNWPDNITATHIVLFKNPLISDSLFTIFNINYVSEAIPKDIEFYEFNTLNSDAVLANVLPGRYSYLAVAQSTKDTIVLERSAWFVSGIYSLPNDISQPKALVLQENSFEQNINIFCDFNNPPPQPPGGK